MSCLERTRDQSGRDLLGESHERVAEQRVLTLATVVDERERSAVADDVVHGLHPLAASGIGAGAYGLNGTFVPRAS
jgi:hypothetical protein